ncbi:MAG: sigma-70 family RNA polymerase sigma factor [Flavobacteriia bacterium]|jgi:RNA polymerase sigma factor (sigma-70 family)|nr:MAG: sigma-70 family RNA polymerase sigma factor [Flavobacteriia bacterium]
MYSEPEKHLLLAAQAGERKAQLALYQLCYPVLISAARRYYHNTDEQMTVVNNAYIKVILHLESYQTGRFLSWVKRIISNEIIDEYRRNKRYNELYRFDAPVEERGVQDFQTDAIFTNEQLQNLLLQLSEPARLVFNLFAIEGYSHKEIAQQLGVTEETSKWHTKMARKKLRELIDLTHEKPSQRSVG